MKKKQTKTQLKNPQVKFQKTLINVLTLSIFGAIFLLCGVAVYFDEKKSLEKTDRYLNSLPSLEDTLSHENVCMEDDLYSYNPRIPVLVGRKTYYGCNQKTIKYLSSNESLRFVIDPIDKSKIDKATAIISLHPERSGKVIYFGSKETYNKYLMTLKQSKTKVEFNLLSD